MAVKLTRRRACSRFPNTVGLPSLPQFIFVMSQFLGTFLLLPSVLQDTSRKNGRPLLSHRSSRDRTHP